MANPDVGALEAQRKINQDLRLYSASMPDFIRIELMATTRDVARSIGLKRFSRFHPLDDDPLYQRKLPIYRSILCVAVTNNKRDADDVFTGSDTDSRVRL